MKISVGILCYNEEKFIRACLEGALEFADEIFVSDGTMNGTTVAVGQRSPVVEPSSDKTREIIAEYEKHGLLETVYLDGLPTPAERDVRNIHYDISSGDYFVIVDADEIWTQETWEPIEDDVLAHPDILDFKVPNRLFMTSPYYYIRTAHWRIFRKIKREFYGNNEMTVSKPDDQHVVRSSNGFHHYGYVDPAGVKRKMDLYSGSYYGGCGPWWFEHIWKNLPHDIEGLKGINGNTLHPWGTLYPGYDAEEWRTMHYYDGEHSEWMREYFEAMGWLDVKYIE
jgi:glycosyltransferase involved in cell wall biosynthesis